MLIFLSNKTAPVLNILNVGKLRYCQISEEVIASQPRAAFYCIFLDKANDIFVINLIPLLEHVFSSLKFKRNIMLNQYIFIKYIFLSHAFIYQVL